MKNYFQVLKIVSLAVILSLGVSFVYAWVEPLSTPPEDNVDAPLNISGAGQIKQGGLLVGFSEALDNINPNTGLSYSGLLVPHGNVGIGTTAPVSKLDVAGGVRLGNEATVCSSIIKGTIRFVEDKIQLCNGKVWKTLSEEPLEGTMVTFEGLPSGSVSTDIAFDGSHLWVVGITPAGDWGDPVIGNLTRVSPIGGFTSFNRDGWRPVVVGSNGKKVWAGNLGGKKCTEVSLAGQMSDKDCFGGELMAMTSGGGKTYMLATGGAANSGIGVAGSNSADISLGTANQSTTDFAYIEEEAFAIIHGTRLALVGSNVAKNVPSATIYLDFPQKTITAVAYGDGNLWVVSSLGEVTKIPVLVGDISKRVSLGNPVTFPGRTGASPVDVVFDGTNLWTANSGDGSVTKITPTGEMVTYTGTGAKPVAIAFDGVSHVWTVNQEGGSVTRIQSR